MNYTDLAMSVAAKGTVRLAGIRKDWNRELIIGEDISKPFGSTGVHGVLVYPAGALADERDRMRRAAERFGFKTIEELPAPQTIREYYIHQKVIRWKDRIVMVVDVEDDFTDVALLDGKSIKSVYRIDSGSNDWDLKEVSGAFLVSQIISAMMRMRNKAAFYEGIVLLAGRFWRNRKHLELMEERLPGYRLYAYKPQDAALLGAVIYASNQCRPHIAYNLTPPAYWCPDWQNMNIYGKAYENIGKSMLEDLLSGKKEIMIPESDKDFGDVFSTLISDHPEIDILVESCAYVTRVENGNKQWGFLPGYRNGGKELLAEIDRKAEEIIRECLGRQRPRLTDEEVVEAVYTYLCNHYEYTKAPKKNGRYPEYTYTMEALLRGGVCAGYAFSVVYILRKLQIGALYIRGVAGGDDFGRHAWNLVPMVDGTYRHIDATWDLGSKREQFRYFGLDDIAMQSRKHVCWNRKRYPKCV